MQLRHCIWYPSLRAYHNREALSMNGGLKNGLHFGWQHPYAFVGLQPIIADLLLGELALNFGLDQSF